MHSAAGARRRSGGWAGLGRAQAVLEQAFHQPGFEDAAHDVQDGENAGEDIGRGGRGAFILVLVILFRFFRSRRAQGLVDRILR